MLGLIFILKFFPHSEHVFLSNDKVVEVLHNLKDKLLVLQFLSDTVANAFTELICLKDVAELFQNSLRPNLGV